MIYRPIYSIVIANALLSTCLTFVSSANSKFSSGSTSGYNYVETGVDLRGKKCVVIEVQSESDVCVALVTTPGDYIQQMYEIVFDPDDLDLTLIKIPANGQKAAISLLTTSVLQDGTVPVTLWISWANGCLQAGKGDQIGKNLISHYPDNSNIKNITTIAVSSWSGCTASWKIAYNQNATCETPEQYIVDNDLDYDDAICQDVIFPAKSTVIQSVDLQVILDGRTSFMVRLNDYQSLSYLVLNSSQGVFSFRLYQHQTCIYKDGNKLAIYNVAISNLAWDAAPGYYWVSWRNGLVAFGYGPDIGKQAMMIYDTFEPIRMQDATAIVNGTISIPFRYYVGPKALKRKSVENAMKTQEFHKQESDSCFTGAVIKTVQNPACRPMKCSLFCSNTPGCTAFCLHQPNSTTKQCSCELQAKPGSPTSKYFYRDEEGATYWEIKS